MFSVSEILIFGAIFDGNSTSLPAAPLDGAGVHPPSTHCGISNALDGDHADIFAPSWGCLGSILIHVGRITVEMSIGLNWFHQISGNIVWVIDAGMNIGDID